MTLISFYFLYCSLLSLGTFYQVNENSARLIQERRQARQQRREESRQTRQQESAYHQLSREISVAEDEIRDQQALVVHLRDQLDQGINRYLARVIPPEHRLTRSLSMDTMDSRLVLFDEDVHKWRASMGLPSRIVSLKKS
jgi:hypothetical protein